MSISAPIYACVLSSKILGHCVKLLSAFCMMAGIASGRCGLGHTDGGYESLMSQLSQISYLSRSAVAVRSWRRSKQGDTTVISHEQQPICTSGSHAISEGVCTDGLGCFEKGVSQLLLSLGPRPSVLRLSCLGRCLSRSALTLSCGREVNRRHENRAIRLAKQCADKNVVIHRDELLSEVSHWRLLVMVTVMSDVSKR